MNRKNERGLTLVELVIGMAVMALVGAAIFGVLSSSLRAYQYGANDERAFAQARTALSNVAAELRYDALVTSPAAGETATQISYSKNGEARSISLGTGVETGYLVFETPAGRRLVGDGLIKNAAFTTNETNNRRIDITVTAAQNTGGAAASLTMTMSVYLGSI